MPHLASFKRFFILLLFSWLFFLDSWFACLGLLQIILLYLRVKIFAMNTYSIFRNLHSGFRYIVFVLILVAIIQSLLGWLGKKPYTEVNRKINLFTLISAHTQLLIGIVLYFLSPLVQFNSNTMKDAATRYFTVEHWVMMLVAIALITVGYSKSKRKLTAESKHKTIAIFYIIAFLIILGAIFAGHIPLLGAWA